LSIQTRKACPKSTTDPCKLSVALQKRTCAQPRRPTHMHSECAVNCSAGRKHTAAWVPWVCAEQRNARRSAHRAPGVECKNGHHSVLCSCWQDNKVVDEMPLSTALSLLTQNGAAGAKDQMHRTSAQDRCPDGQYPTADTSGARGSSGCARCPECKQGQYRSGCGGRRGRPAPRSTGTCKECRELQRCSSKGSVRVNCGNGPSRDEGERVLYPGRCEDCRNLWCAGQD
jgi:hypothetical protein